MVAPPVKKKVLQCHRKRRFNNELEARAVGSAAMDAQPGLKLYVYRCPICGTWHLTRNNNGRRAEVKAWEKLSYE